MKNILSYLKAPAAIICWCFFSLQGCKQPAIESTQLLTSDDNLNLSKDTLKLIVSSVFEQPLASNGVSNGVLGTINDQIFGNSYAGFYAQCQLTTDNVYFGVSPVLDSAVLTLAYNGIYGKFSQPVTVSVFELNQDVNDSTTYKTNQAFGVKVPPIGQITNFVPDTLSTDSIVALNGILPPHIRIRLSNAFGTKILTVDSNALLDNTSFLYFFKGIYVTTSASLTGNGMAYINLASSFSGITLFYHNTTSDSLYYTLPISGVTINHFDNSYMGTPVYTSVNAHNPNGAQKVYVQGGAGVNGKIIISNLDSLPKNIAINKAEFIFSQSAPDTQFLAPLVLNLFRIDDAGQGQTLEDDAAGTIGGVRTAETVGNSTITRYRFNVKQYFQKLLEGVYHNNGFYLKAFVANSNSERVVIDNSPTDKNYQVTLVVTYTKL